MSSKSSSGDSSSSPLTEAGPAEPTTAEQPLSDQVLPQASTDLDLYAPMNLHTTHRTAHAPHQNVDTMSQTYRD